MELFWTPGWKDALTLLVAPLATLAGVWITQSFQSRKAELESRERHTDNLREALADLLAQHWSIGMALGDVHAAKLDAYQLANKSDDVEFVLTRGQQAARQALIEATAPLFTAITRVNLLTRNQRILSAVKTLDDDFEVALNEAGVVPTELRHIKTWQSACDAVQTAFQAARAVAAEECATEA